MRVAASAAAALGALLVLPFVLSSPLLPDQRPSYDKRTFHSKAVDDLIDQLVPMFNDQNLGVVFRNCLPNTLDTTIYYTSPNPETVSPQNRDSFVITGDIDAMWLRDSMNQVLPYLPYAPSDSDLSYLIEGLINRQAKSIVIDPFANAFNFNASGEGHQDDYRKPPMGPDVFEGKYEVDSLNAFLKLSYWHWRYSGTAALTRFVHDTWFQGVAATLDTIATMQHDNGQSMDPPYLFSRLTTAASDTLIIQQRGPPCKPNGLTRSLFRPSDDAVTLPYNIPGNAMTCVELTHLEELLNAASTALPSHAKVISKLLNKSAAVRTPLCEALRSYAASDIIPFEVDGFGSFYRMDDANLPSLLSLPATGYLSVDSPAYQATRSYVLSSDNPYYFSGPAGHGVGGPHEGVNLTWPMALIMQAMTSSDDQEISDCLRILLTTTAGTGMMHEAFNVFNANIFTRSWFAWANGLFGELILQLIVTKPHLVLKDDPSVVSAAQQLVRAPVSLQAQKEVLVK